MKLFLLPLLIALSLVIPVTGSAQSPRKQMSDPYGQITVFAGGGVAYYMGDISANMGSGNLGLGPAFLLGGTYRLTERISAVGQLRLYKVSGDSQYTNNPEKNLSFKTTNPDLQFALRADLFPYSRRSRVNPYAQLGLGVTYLTPKAEWEGAVHSLAKYQTEGEKYWRLPIYLSGGIGTMVRVTNNWSAGVELTGNFLFSDYLDDVSTNYPEYDQLGSDLAFQLSYRGTSQEPGFIRGNPKSKDIYVVLAAKVAYALPNKKYAKERKATKCSY
jgi:hypothetical protein